MLEVVWYKYFARLNEQYQNPQQATGYLIAIKANILSQNVSARMKTDIVNEVKDDFNIWKSITKSQPRKNTTQDPPSGGNLNISYMI
jgi:hypothetical protein